MSATTEANKQVVKMRKVEALCKQLLDEWVSISEEKKEDAFTIIGTRFLEKVPAEYLASMAEQFAIGAENGLTVQVSKGGANGFAGKGPGSAGAQKEVAEAAPAGEDEEFEDAAEEAAEPEEVEEVAIGKDGSNRFHEAMKDFLQENRIGGEAQWAKAWSSLAVSPEDESEALTTLFEVPMHGDGGANGAELTARMAVELARLQQVQMKPIEQALEALAGRLEGFVQENENAWHLHSQVLMLLFPKTPSTPWGLLRVGWNWTSWWLTAQRVLEACDRYRAFDILVLVLQMMQEKSGAVIKQQQVWKEGGRAAKVRQALCGWGEMDDASIVETLTAYGVEI